MKKVAFFRYNLLNRLSLAFDLVYTKIFFVCARLVRLLLYCRGSCLVSFGQNLITGRFCRIDPLSVESELIPQRWRPKIIFGSDVQIGDRVHLASVELLVIDSNVLIASNVFISDHDHGTTRLESMDLPPMLPEL